MIDFWPQTQRNELLNGEIFDTLQEARILIERWRVQCQFVQLFVREYSGREPGRGLSFVFLCRGQM